MKPKRRSASEALKSIEAARQWVVDRAPRAIQIWEFAAWNHGDSRLPYEQVRDWRDFATDMRTFRRAVDRLVRRFDGLFLPPRPTAAAISAMFATLRDRYPANAARLAIDEEHEVRPLRSLEQLQAATDALDSWLQRELGGLRSQWPQRKRGQRRAVDRAEWNVTVVRDAWSAWSMQNRLTAAAASVVAVALGVESPTANSEARRTKWHRQLLRSGNRI